MEVNFSELKVGDIFYCWGDQILNYDSPIWCKCIKDSESSAHEIDGINFSVDKNSTVNIEIEE